MNNNSKIKFYSEKIILENYLKKLNFNKNGTFNFENDGAYIKLNKNKKIVVTSDSISENIDFFRGDSAKSLANKILTVNISDLYAMGAKPYAYTLNLFIPNYIDLRWIEEFTKELYKLQKKNNFYLLGGDLSKSNKLIISSTFFGYSPNDRIVKQNILKSNSDIWVTGNIGDSFAGLQILKKKILIKNKKIRNYFINKYYHPKPCNFGIKISNYIESMKDISDGLIGDLQKMLRNNFGAQINIKNIPISNQLKNIIKFNKMNFHNILNCGDDYELIIISSNKNRKKVQEIAKTNKVKITRIGKIVKNIGITDDSNNLLNISREFDHFS